MLYHKVCYRQQRKVWKKVKAQLLPNTWLVAFANVRQGQQTAEGWFAEQQGRVQALQRHIVSATI